MSIGARPPSHGEWQKLALSPRPTVTTVEARKRALSILSKGGADRTQGLSGSIQSQTQRRHEEDDVAERGSSKALAPGPSDARDDLELEAAVATSYT